MDNCVSISCNSNWYCNCSIVMPMYCFFLNSISYSLNLFPFIAFEKSLLFFQKLVLNSVVCFAKILFCRISTHASFAVLCYAIDWWWPSGEMVLQHFRAISYNTVIAFNATSVHNSICFCILIHALLLLALLVYKTRTIQNCYFEFDSFFFFEKINRLICLYFSVEVNKNVFKFSTGIR